MVGLSVCVPICLFVTFVSPAKTVEPIEMPFEGQTRVVYGTIALDGDPDATRRSRNFGGRPSYSKFGSRCLNYRTQTVSVDGFNGSYVI